MSHFKLKSSIKASDVIPVSKYVSEKTGLTVIIANVEGPLVNGFFCLATEAHDDDGLPHTLEHLIFLGSERYPYKGILDLLANRCMAHGTNAWTDTDHTCYTIYTAGDAGMLTLLPIYIDHILRPTLTDEGFITEVHHVNGEGEDAGVVYCEIQGRENTADTRCELKLLRAMYPNSGYSADTGGIMENLRISTDNIKVRDYHKKFYRAENLTIILTGQIEADDVFNVLATVEDDIIAKREKEVQEEWVKPWQTIPPPPNYGELREQWPADTEDCGQVMFGWRGPILTEPTALKELTGCAVLLRYLCDTAAAPLQRALVEREDALAGDVSYNLTENIAPLIKIELDNVPVDKLEIARDEARNCLKSVINGDEAIVMERMKRLLRKQLRETMASLESDPHHAIAFRCIGDALYSQNEDDFISRMNPHNSLNELLKENSDYWLGLLKKYFSDDLVTIIGSPSIKLQAKIAEDEKKRIEEQRVQLGEEGLAEKSKILDDAMEFNERPPPPGTLASVPVPSCENLKCHNISSWNSGGEPCPHFDLKEIPMYTRVHSLNTNFVYMSIILDTTNVDQMTRKWLPLHLNALAECPVRRGDKLIPHEEVISTTEQLTVSFSNDIGFGRSGNFAVGQFGHFVQIETRCEPVDYEEVVNHLYEILYAAEINKERLLVFAQRLINDVSQVRRNGHKMVYDILRDSLYCKDSNVHWSSVLRQQKFLKELIEQLNAGGDSAEAALSEAKEMFKNITENAWLHLAADLEKYKLSTEPWKRFARENEIMPLEPKLYWDADLMSGWGGGMVVGVGGLDSSFVVQLSEGPLGNALVDVAPLSVALNYFTQLEGPMWRLIRGGGLSYGYGIRPSQNEGRLVFSLYRATNAVAAYNKAKSIVDEYLADGKFDEDLFASAKSTALFEVVENEKCVADVVGQSLLNYVRRAGETYNRELVCAIAAVTQKEAHAAAARWLPRLFRADAGKLAVVCHPTKVADMQAAFHKINVQLDAFDSMEASHFNK
ncbi:uncharacterized protein C05D11.1-like [Maniola hyperantus]|uniref:uncharacterized protein C05D11.1-like n=1 Tax=Aphantopus hyperantus TaxID=2795564 RepID=UPI001568157C|nr:uncharacterized protein C05D11.1-like [Maniola hyperantus]